MQGDMRAISELVEKEDTAVAEGDLARGGRAAASDDGDVECFLFIHPGVRLTYLGYQKKVIRW